MQVTVKTTLGPAATPLSVFVSLEIPRLVVGAASDPPYPWPLETKTGRKTETDYTHETAAATAGVGVENGHRNRFRSRYGSGLPLRFPPTQVGEWREVFIEVANPADVPVRVQLASASGEPAMWTERGQASEAIVASGVGADVSVALETASTSLPAAAAGTAGGFSGDTISAQTRARTGQQSESLARDGTSTPVAGKAAPGAFHVGVGGFVPEVLPPGGRTILGPVRFAPSRDGLFSAHVYLLNNITHVEPVALEGEAGSGLLVIRPWGSSGPQAAVEVGVGFPKDSAEGFVARGSRAEERNDEVTRFPVDFRSWARLPPTTEPVVKRWVLSNEGTIPLTVHGVGIRRVGGGGWGGGAR